MTLRKPNASAIGGLARGHETGVVFMAPKCFGTAGAACDWGKCQQSQSRRDNDSVRANADAVSKARGSTCKTSVRSCLIDANFSAG